MSLKFFKDNLPWIAPSAAIVFAASGYFDRGGKYVEQTQPKQETPAALISAAPPVTDPLVNVNFQTAGAIQPETQQLARNSEVVARLSMVTDAALRALDTQNQPDQVVSAIAPQVQAQAAPAPQELAYNSPADAAAFFTQAKANISAIETCKTDLQSLAGQAKVYFPSGGLNVDETGIEQARLIGMLAQKCTGVQIVVEGHSDPSGDPAANLKLSQKRAEQVIQRIGAAGIDTSMFLARGVGDIRPSGLDGPKGSAFYDRRVEFSVLNTASAVASTSQARVWATTSCVAKLETAVTDLNVFYTPRSIAAKSDDLDAVMEVASMAQNCPEARLRVIGQHSDNEAIGETVGTGILRAKALMMVLVSRGIESGNVIIAAPSRSEQHAGLVGSRVDFDVIVE